MSKEVLDIGDTKIPALPETCYNDLDKMGGKELEFFKSMRDPIKRLMKRVEEEQDRVAAIFDDLSKDTPKGKGRGTDRLKGALEEVGDIYNNPDSLDQMQKDIQTIDETLRKFLLLRRRRQETLKGWNDLVGDIEQKTSDIGQKLSAAEIEARREEREGGVAATFEVARLRGELVSLEQLIMDILRPETDESVYREVLEKDDISGLVHRLNDLSARLRSLSSAPHPGSVQSKAEKKTEKDRRWTA